jgi:ferredoxin--NADP+ reductase
MPSEKHLSAKIVDRQDYAKDLFILRVAHGGPFSFLAGQYATLGVELEGKRLERPYSICSSPYEELLEFFVERVQGGELSPLLHAMEKGTPLLLRRFAKGRFNLDPKSGRKHHLLLATVTGVAPFVSFIRTLLADWQKGGSPMPGDHRFFCIHGASRSQEFGYRSELEKVAADVPWFKYVPAVSRPWEDPEWNGETGRVDDVIRKYTDLWGLKRAETTVYLCGHPAMVENGREILLRAGWDRTALQDEVYFQPGKEATAGE